MAIKPIYNAFASRPKSQGVRNPMVAVHAMIRDQFSIATWLSFGAIIQATAYTLLPYRNLVTILPVVLFLAYKLTYTACILTGLLPNPRMSRVNPQRTTLVFPTAKGSQETPADAPICAIILGVVSNHPLGMLGPGFREVGDRFDKMCAEMSADATKHGFLGYSSWLNAADNATSSEFMSVLYFENEVYLHEYAHGPMHTEALQWWRETERRIPHIGIMHEVFACPKRSWEGIYINYPPVGLGATTKEVTAVDGKKSWVSPLVKVGGKLLYSKGRMGRDYGEHEWDAHASLEPSGLD